MSNLCVIGLQWGDEAKGKLVDLLTDQFEIVVRYQGGSNAGHTVVVGDQIYKLHLIPSGILNPRVTNVVASGVVVHPETLVQEIDSLSSRSIEISDRLKLSDRAHVVMPWHVVEDQLWNEAESGDESIGTTLRGIGPCYSDKVGRRFAIRLGDMLQADFPQRIAQICEFKNRLINQQDEQSTVFSAPDIAAQYQEFGERLRPMICDTNEFLLNSAETGRRILFEGAQGALLDVDHGTYPFVTSSNSSGVGVCAGAGVPARFIHKVIGVAKCYTTRVGGGPFPTELDNEIGQHIREIGREYGTTTGRPRRCGWFDAVAVRYTVRLSGVDFLSMMMLDVLSSLDEINICVGYEIDGRAVDGFPSRVDQLRKARPVYETLPGWKSDITQARAVDDLPENALHYIQRISQLIGRPVRFISVGPERRQTIHYSELTSVA